jgi:hypothetical protein
MGGGDVDDLALRRLLRPQRSTGWYSMRGGALVLISDRGPDALTPGDELDHAVVPEDVNIAGGRIG